MRDASTSAGSSVTAGRIRRWRGRILLAVILCAWTGTALWHTYKPLPEGVRVESEWHPVPENAVRFIADVTTADAYGRPIVSQAIFDEVLAIIRSARELLVLDFFLFNDHKGALEDNGLPLRPLSSELREALLERRRAEPRMQILLITDPINDVYGGAPSADLQALREAGIDVVTTNLDALRDSNFIYSSLWRLAIDWWDGDAGGKGWLPNPFDPEAPKITLRAWARLLNFKANHRKVIIGDDGRGGLVGIVGSANPHDASSAHSNAALWVAGPALVPLIQSELAIARLSGWRGQIRLPDGPPGARRAIDTPLARVKVLTEGAIRDAILERISEAAQGDFIDIAMFYLSDREIIEALLAASRRGAQVRLILDPNKDAFGRTKSGIPNRPAATELAAASDGAIHVRWYRTRGEQFHTKMVMIRDAERLWLTLGSANLTRRNLRDYNLEANLAVEASAASELAIQALGYFNTLWNNETLLGIEYTADFGVYADPTQSRYWLYRITEATGLSTF